MNIFFSLQNQERHEDELTEKEKELIENLQGAMAETWMATPELFKRILKNTLKEIEEDEIKKMRAAALKSLQERNPETNGNNTVKMNEENMSRKLIKTQIQRKMNQRKIQMSWKRNPRKSERRS